MNKVELQSIVGGQLQEKFKHAFEKVIENLQDPNTSYKVKRGINIKLDFVQTEARDNVAVSVLVTEKLAPQQDMNTMFYIGKDLRTGVMIKDALQYLVGLGKAEEHSIYSDKYSDKPLYRIDPYYPKADSIKMHTLTSLVDYIKSNTDEMEDHMIIDVRSPEEVALYSKLDENRDREEMVIVTARIPEFPFNSFMDQEKFCINLQSKFIDDPQTDRALILKFAGTVESGTVAEYGDDGVTQKATVKTGLATKTDAIVPNPVKLRPYRTFLEVEQPASDFIFRMKQDKYDGIACAIYEADGGAWKMAAAKAIKEYLQFELADMPQFTVIS